MELPKGVGGAEMGLDESSHNALTRPVDAPARPSKEEFTANVPRPRAPLARLGFIAWGCLAAGAGCDAGTDGELGAGEFAYQCDVGANDPGCTGVAPYPMPLTIFVSSEFGVVYQGDVPEKDGFPLAVRVVPASGKHLEEVTKGQFRALEPGFVALLAQAADGTVADFVHTELVPIGAIDILRDGVPVTMATLGPSESISLTAQAFATGSDVASGDVEYEWVSTNEQVAVVDVFGGHNDVTLRAIGPGTATVTATVGQVASALTVNVGGVP